MKLLKLNWINKNDKRNSIKNIVFLILFRLTLIDWQLSNSLIISILQVSIALCKYVLYKML